MFAGQPQASFAIDISFLVQSEFSLVKSACCLDQIPCVFPHSPLLKTVFPYSPTIEEY